MNSEASFNKELSPVCLPARNTSQKIAIFHEIDTGGATIDSSRNFKMQ